MTTRTLTWKLGRLAILSGAALLASFSQPTTRPRAAACAFCNSPTDCEWQAGVDGWDKCSVSIEGCTISGNKCYSS